MITLLFALLACLQLIAADFSRNAHQSNSAAPSGVIPQLLGRSVNKFTLRSGCSSGSCESIFPCFWCPYLPWNMYTQRLAPTTRIHAFRTVIFAYAFSVIGRTRRLTEAIQCDEFSYCPDNTEVRLFSTFGITMCSSGPTPVLG